MPESAYEKPITSCLKVAFQKAPTRNKISKTVLSSHAPPRIDPDFLSTENVSTKQAVSQHTLYLKVMKTRASIERSRQNAPQTATSVLTMERRPVVQTSALDTIEDRLKASSPPTRDVELRLNATLDFLEQPGLDALPSKSFFLREQKRLNEEIQMIMSPPHQMLRKGDGQHGKMQPTPGRPFKIRQR